MGAEWKVVALSSALAFVVAVPLVYLPAMMLVRRALRGYRPLVWFPIVAALVGVVPTAFIMFAWGGGIEDLFSPEASIFYVMFLVVGVVFGLGYALGRDVVT
jgi:hypothetical protein